MPSSRDHFESFIAALHRRFIWAKLLERIGLCCLAGGGAAVALAPILIYRGESAATLSVGALAGGALFGLIWGIVKMPTRTQAALEADTQLNLADLLTTALQLRGEKRDDEWRNAVLLMAEARCRDLKPGTVIFRRYGARTWSGIGLVACAALTLAAISAVPSGTRAAQETSLSVAAPQRSLDAADAPILAAADGEDAAIAATDLHKLPENVSRRPVPSSADAIDPAMLDVPPSNSRRRPAAGSGQDAGQGSAQTTPPIQTDPAPQLASNNGEKDESGRDPAAGIGASSEASVDGSSGSRISDPLPARSDVPIWESSEWSNHQSLAQAALQSGNIPDEYREMVRAYFDRP